MAVPGELRCIHIERAAGSLVSLMNMRIVYIVYCVYIVVFHHCVTL